MSSTFSKVDGGIDELFGGEKHSHAHFGRFCDDLHPPEHVSHRFHSFASQSSGHVKWFVDGCSYFWAVSEALENAEETIYILDWWLSPELYLRRPPSKNEQYRLDKLLQAAAERGVQIYIIVYKEVTAALTLDSAHTKQALEALHPNIHVFRHPDHIPTGYDIRSEFGKAWKKLTHFDLARSSHDAVKEVYGVKDEIVLYWAHHEKLIIVDKKMGFMGGLDLCFGRWDTNSHPIADAHPGDLDAIIFPGQDYNNARIYDFTSVSDWNQNKLDRTRSSRMGWSDVAVNMKGHVVKSLVHHFEDRWNYIFDAKYHAKDPAKYNRIQVHHGFPNVTKGKSLNHYVDSLAKRFSKSLGKFDSSDDDHSELQIQLTRSCTRWSAGHQTEHSIANAYVQIIGAARHFIYIENQFFITATSKKQHPVVNKIGAAIVDRVTRAHERQQRFKVWVVMPAVPAFAGDLKSNDALGTRAIMKYQYNSICRGGNSILEKLQQAGIQDPSQYIGFYNLRSFDRINTSDTMKSVEKQTGASYEQARKEHDDKVGAGHFPEGEGTGGATDTYETYQKAATGIADNTRDTVSSSYMDGNYSLLDLQWDGKPEEEMNAFVCEELYIHSKVLIADDEVVICGSANLNDRSQLGTHDSEIAVVIEGGPRLETTFNGTPVKVSKFASSLRRQIFRKHLGLLPDQRWDKPDQNWKPITEGHNDYDWGSPADFLVRDPMHANFSNLWTNTAKANTEIFRRAFHPVPDDSVRSWADYDKFFSNHVFLPNPKKPSEQAPKGKVDYGHVIPSEFPGGVQEVKAWLARIRGTLVEMPLNFLADEMDIAKQGLTLNSLTDEIYT